MSNKSEIAASFKGGTPQVIALSQLDASPEQPQGRADKTHPRVLELAASMKLHGFSPLFPIIVRQRPSGRYEIGSGHRRFAAAVLAGLAKVPCIVVQCSNDLWLDLILASNTQDPFTRLQEGRLIAVRLREGKSLGREIGYRTYARDNGLDEGALQHLLQAVKVLDAVQAKGWGVGDMVIRRKKGIETVIDLNAKHIRHLSAIHALKRSSEWVSVCERVIAENLTVAKTQELVQELNEPKPAPKPDPAPPSKPPVTPEPAPVPPAQPPPPATSTIELPSPDHPVFCIEWSAAGLDFDNLFTLVSTACEFADQCNTSLTSSESWVVHKLTDEERIQVGLPPVQPIEPEPAQPPPAPPPAPGDLKDPTKFQPPDAPPPIPAHVDDPSEPFFAHYDPRFLESEYQFLMQYPPEVRIALIEHHVKYLLPAYTLKFIKIRSLPDDQELATGDYTDEAVAIIKMEKFRD